VNPGDYATPYEVFKKLTGIDAIILVQGIRLSQIMH